MKLLKKVNINKTLPFYFFGMVLFKHSKIICFENSNIWTTKNEAQKVEQKK